MISWALSIQFSGDAPNAGHEDCRLLHRSLGAQLPVVESFHPEPTHMTLCRGKGGVFQHVLRSSALSRNWHSTGVCEGNAFLSWVVSRTMNNRS